MEDDLVASGRYARLETTGRISGTARVATVGAIPGPGDSLLVAAGEADAGWAANLLADPDCRVTVGDRTFEARAVELEGAAFAAAIRELILRYGTPAERLGSGPAFRLEPVVPADARVAG